MGLKASRLSGMNKLEHGVLEARTKGILEGDDSKFLVSKRIDKKNFMI